MEATTILTQGGEHRSSLVRRITLARFTCAALASLAAIACGKSLPDPVVVKDGYACIPIDGTMYRIPEKSWLTGYSRNSTDGQVHSFSLHATVPDVQPWSQARNELMYPRIGFGQKLSIYVPSQSDIGRDWTYQLLKGDGDWRIVFRGSQYMEEPSDQKDQGLRRFRSLWDQFDESRAHELEENFGRDFVERRRADSGKPMLGRLYYMRIAKGLVKYFIDCDDRDQVYKLCRLRAPRGKTLFVNIDFPRSGIGNIMQMADLVWEKLIEFEVDGKNCSVQPTPMIYKLKEE